MATLKYNYESGNESHSLEMVFVEGTRGQPFLFGDPNETRSVEVRDFFISKLPVTQALWKHVMGANPSVAEGDHKPVENVSWLDVTGHGGFLERINASKILADIARLRAGLDDSTQQDQSGNTSEHGKGFRLPSETEWEYAARGGPHWAEGFRFSGSNEVDAVAWYMDNSGDRGAAWLPFFRLLGKRPPTRTHDAGQKQANQLGIHDMSGNVWEWCQDSFIRDVNQIPNDGSAFVGEGSERILRGGCHHNWSVHCTVSKRYEIAEDAHDGCIGFRLALGVR